MCKTGNKAGFYSSVDFAFGIGPHECRCPKRHHAGADARQISRRMGLSDPPQFCADSMPDCRAASV